MSNDVKKPEVKELTQDEKVTHLSIFHPSIQQFENSLKFIQGGTGMTLDRMILSLRRLCREMIEEGIKLEKEATNATDRKMED